MASRLLIRDRSPLSGVVRRCTTAVPDRAATEIYPIMWKLQVQEQRLRSLLLLLLVNADSHRSRKAFSSQTATFPAAPPTCPLPSPGPELPNVFWKPPLVWFLFSFFFPRAHACRQLITLRVACVCPHAGSPLHSNTGGEDTASTTTAGRGGDEKAVGVALNGRPGAFEGGSRRPESSKPPRGRRRRHALPPMVAVLKIWAPNEATAALLVEGAELRLHR